MKRMILICLATFFLIAASLWAAENQPMKTRDPSSSGSEYGTEGMGPGMMGPGSGYHGWGPGMMGHDHYGGHGMGGYGHRMGPDPQGWQDMSPEQREQWRQMRSRFMQDTLSLRQELTSKKLELETLWDQKNPDSEKVKALSNRIRELRSKLDQKYDEYLNRCRQEFGDRGWACPGAGRQRY